MSGNTVDLQELYHIVKKRWKMILTTALCLAVITGIVSFLIPPTYEAETSIRIKQPKGLTNSLLSDLPIVNQSNTKQQMATYAEIIQSRTVVQAVIDAWQVDQNKTITYEEMLRRITTQSVKDTEILKVKVRAPTPAEAQFLAQTLVETFINRMTYLVRAEETTVREFIGARLVESKKELERAEAALEVYKRNEKIVAPTEETKSMVDRVTAIKTLTADNAVAMASSQAKLASLEQQMANQPSGFIADSPLIQQLKGKLTEQEVSLVGLRQNYAAKHPKVMAVQAEIAETKARLNAEISRVINAEAPSANPVHQAMLQAKMQSEAEVAANQAQRVAIGRIMAQGEQDLVKLPGKEQGFARLTRDMLINQEIYSMLARRYEEARISEIMQPTDVQIIDVAVTPEKPVSSRKTLNILIAAVIGLLAGLVAAFITEYSNRRVRTQEDVKEYLDLPVLANIPDFGDVRLVPNNGRWNKWKVRLGL